MSGYINSLILEPAWRQARRFSSPRPEAQVTPDLHTQATVSSDDPQSTETIDDPHLDSDTARDEDAPLTDSEPGQIPLNDLRETYSHEEDTYRAEEVAPTERDAIVARENGLQGLLPLNDVRTNYLADEDRVDSPAVLETVNSPQDRMPSESRQTQDGRTLDSLSSMSLDHTMTSNPSHVASQDLMSAGGSSSSLSSRSRRNQNQQPQTSGSLGPHPMSANLPEDDGMMGMRRQMHQIREMALSSEEKARRMHELMSADYKRFKALSEPEDALSDASYDQCDNQSAHAGSWDPNANRDRATSQLSSKSVGSRKESLTVTADDLVISYQPRTDPVVLSPEASGREDEDDDQLPLGCAHYQRNVKVQCPDCQNWYPCRHCHDESEKHPLNRTKIRNMLCMLCGTPQRAGEYCKQCGELTAAYYCDICKLWDNNTDHKIYHCPDCGICRRGEGLGKDYVHCKRCNVCINISYEATHRCVERATECDCPICGEWMFTSSLAVVAVQCGHYMHRPCHDALMRTSFKCPICSRSAVNMELQWRKLDQAIEAQPMPSQFQETKVWITCNDCSARTCTRFHWLGNKCMECDSYNTNQVKMVNSPTEQELQALQESREVQALREAERRMGTQDGNAAAGVPPQAQHLQPSNRTAPPVLTPERPVAWQPSPSRPGHPEQVQHNGLASSHTAPIRVNQRPNSGSYFPHHSPSHRGSTTDESGDLEMTDPSVSGTEDERESEGDDVTFWGDPVSPGGWSMPSMPEMPRMPSMPNVPRPDWPRMPSVSMPTMPNMSMPNIPSVGVPRAISPTTIWAAGSPTFSGWNLPSPNFFPLRRGLTTENDATTHDDDDDDYDGEEDSSSSSDEDQTMDWEMEEDGDVDEMELFGHR